ncbi:hypothetical protein C9374_006068 [Naegleria lovaniensis]|uniref:RGS domain-containing protein n=1 Tax=Naegleria lovaniensis TaxID=51637 RepID=A0AA88GMH2_NAELO|nr:uncharacterized protein C9374_006068 [Naegleria lovaniensis]KAG2381684.1 hypothetical protein C9374_006068 [Naegleria lovaniensis]
MITTNNSSSSNSSSNVQLTKEERSLFRCYVFDFDRCLAFTNFPEFANTNNNISTPPTPISSKTSSLSNNSNSDNMPSPNSASQTLLSLFKSFLERDCNGRFVPLLSLYLQMKQNPAYYEQALYAEKKKEIESFLRREAFPRFVRSDDFKSHVAKRMRSLKSIPSSSSKGSGDNSNLAINSGTVTMINHSTQIKRQASNSSTQGKLNSSSNTTLSVQSASTLDDASTLVGSNQSNHSHQLYHALQQQPSTPTSSLVSSVNLEAPYSPNLASSSPNMTSNHESDAFEMKASKKDDAADEDDDEENHEDEEEEDDADTESTTTTTTTSSTSGSYQHYQFSVDSTSQTLSLPQSKSSKSRHSVSRHHALLSNKAVMEYLHAIASPMDISTEPLFKTQVEMKSALFFSMDHLSFVKDFENDTPAWEIVYTIPSSTEAVASNKLIPAQIHKDYLSRGGGVFTLQACSPKNNFQRVLNDLSLEKTYKWKYQTFVPYPHHEVFNMFEQCNFNTCLKGCKKQNKMTRQLGTELFDPHFSVSGSGGRDFYCYEEKINLSSGNSLFKFGSSQKTLNLLCSNFYDTDKNEYIFCLKSQGFDQSSGTTNIEVADNVWGVKCITITKITNNLTRVNECGFMYFGENSTKDYFLSPLFNTSNKDKSSFFYNALVMGSEEMIKRELERASSYSNSKHKPSAAQKKSSNSIRHQCLTQNETVVAKRLSTAENDVLE